MRFAKHVIQVTHRPIGMIGVQWGLPMTMVWDPTLMDKGQTPPKPYLYGPMIQRVIEAGEKHAVYWPRAPLLIVIWVRKQSCASMAGEILSA